jgi:hypothetical protein
MRALLVAATLAFAGPVMAEEPLCLPLGDILAGLKTKRSEYVDSAAIAAVPQSALVVTTVNKEKGTWTYLVSVDGCIIDIHYGAGWKRAGSPL